MGLAASVGLQSSTVFQVLLMPAGAIVGLAMVVMGAIANRLRHLRGASSILPAIVLALIDHPRASYGGILTGAAMGHFAASGFRMNDAIAVSIGACLGFGIYGGSRWVQPQYRWWLGIEVGVVVGGAAIAAASAGILTPAGSPTLLCGSLLLSAVIYYILVFAGRSEENEIDIGVICLALALALGSLNLPRTVRSVVILAPLLIYVVYCERIRKNIIVFKYILRGMEHERTGNWEAAIVNYRLAIEKSPRSELALAGQWRVHQHVDPAMLSQRPDLREMIDTRACLARAESILSREETDRYDQAGKLFAIVEEYDRSARRSAILGQARLSLARQDIDQAKKDVERALECPIDQIPALDDRELAGIFDAWMLALRNPGLQSWGSLLLQRPGRRLAFIILLEEKLERNKDDGLASDFKPFAYRALSLADIEGAIQNAPLEHLDFNLCRELAQQASGDETSHAIELYRVAEIGLPEQRLEIWRQIARIHAESDPAQSLDWYRRIREYCRDALSPLTDDERAALVEACRHLAEDAESHGDWSAAADCLETVAKSPSSGMTTIERLYRLYERLEDRLSMIRQVERALRFSLPAADKKWWSQEKDRLYALIQPHVVQSRAVEAGAYFDFRGCLSRAADLLKKKAPADEVDHYLDLASLGGSAFLLEVNYLLGRLSLREGRGADAAVCFDQVTSQKPVRFANEDQKRAYYRSCRILGEIILEHGGDAERAVELLSIYKDQPDSGADTLYLLGQAYERLGQINAARKWYDMVLVYSSHPKAAMAKEALARLTAS